jgi:hypothetical protein
MRAQWLASRTVELTADVMRERRGAMFKTPAGTPGINLSNKLAERIDRAWNNRNALSLIRERVLDEDLRQMLKDLSSNAATYILDPALDTDILAASVKLNKDFEAANERLGKLLRNMI